MANPPSRPSSAPSPADPLLSRHDRLGVSSYNFLPAKCGIAGEMFKQRDLRARAFADPCRAQAAEFPPECRGGDYEKRIQAAYPIHPEIFDRLYGDWSALLKFQRTRGVLRLMAAVIHSLWEQGDRSPLILPSTIPIDDPRVQFELTRYLSDNWVPIIEKDVDGAGSLPLRIDAEVPNLGTASATRRVARTIYLGSAPTAAAAHRGLEDRRVKLGCVMPGEAPAVFGDALRRLAAAATYLYQDGPRAWYATQPTVTKLAEDRAEQLRHDPDKAAAELEARLRADLKRNGDFSRIHALPRSGADVPDDLDARLVVLSADHPCSRESRNPAEVAAKAILESRGTTPRLYRNTLAFLAADRVRLQDLDEALRKYLAWSSIVAEEKILNLDEHQRRQAEMQKQAADGAVTARLPETYQWLLVPEQANPQAPVFWQAARLGGSDALAVRAGRKLRSDETLVPNLGATILKKHMDEVPLWRGDHVGVRQLVDDFARYLYLPRLAGPEVLAQAIRDGIALLTWRVDTFGSATPRAMRRRRRAIAACAAASKSAFRPTAPACWSSRMLPASSWTRKSFPGRPQHPRGPTISRNLRHRHRRRLRRNCGGFTDRCGSIRPASAAMPAASPTR
jgi:hypothetical protein